MQNLKTPNLNLKTPIKFQISFFPQVDKPELWSVQQRRELAICQCHCQCYLIACLKSVWLSLSHQFQSQQENHLKPFNSTYETTKSWKGLMSNSQQWFGCQISRPKSRRKKYVIESSDSNPNRQLPNRIFLNCRITPKKFSNRDLNPSRNWD